MRRQQPSMLFQKRENFRKQIRRQQIQQKFRKIRYQLFQQNSENEQMRIKVNETIQLINAKNYYFPNVDNSDIIDNQRDNKKLQYLLSLSEHQLKEPDQQLRKILYKQSIKTKINHQWNNVIYKWQQSCGEIVQNIITNISKSWSSYSYKIQILQFILHTIQFLNYGNKLRQLRRISNKQIDQKYLVGEPQQYYRSILRKYCQNLLTNFTAIDDDQILLPFLSLISKVIKNHQDFALIYHNLFLTNHIPIGQKLSIFKDFIQFLEISQNSMKDHDTQFIKILYLAYGNQPNIVKVNYNTYLKSLELNYRCLNIIQSYLGVFQLKIQQFYSKDPHNQEYATILEISLILQCIFKEQQSLLAKVNEKPNIFKFIVSRLRKNKQAPEIKCIYYVLKSVCNLAFHTNIYLQISYTFPVLEIQLLTLFNRLYCQLFEESGIQQEGSKLFSQIGKLQLQCLKQILKIFRFTVINQQTSFKYIKNGLVKKLMKICQFWAKNRGIKSLRITKDSCLQIFSLIISNLLRQSYHEKQSQLQVQPVVNLIEEFFYPSESQKINLFGLIEIELSQLSGKGEANNPVLIEIILLMLENLLERIFSQIQQQANQLMHEFEFKNDKKSHSLRRSHWYFLSKSYSQKSEIIKLLNELLYNNNLKFIVSNSKIQQRISYILDISERIDQIIGNDRTNNTVIELQK